MSKSEYDRRWRLSHPEKRAEYWQRYRSKHAEELKEYKRSYYREHVEKLREEARQYRHEHPEKIAEACKRWAKTHPEKKREVQRNNYHAHPERSKERLERYSQRHPETHKKAQRKYDRKHPEKRMHRNIVAHMLKGQCKIERSRQYVGCVPGFLRNHLESLFKPGMNWENYGKEWHVDHIVPLSWFPFDKDPSLLFVASHWTNLQPLWRTENRAKWDRYIA